jgi:hypothetical protein
VRTVERPGSARSSSPASEPGADRSKKHGAIVTPRRPAARLRLATIGFEAEFSLVLDGESVRPEDVFGDPRAFIRGPLLHREGTSYHLPTGGIVYFDTGVIELATPVIELERGCAARAGRSLWESIRFVRRELDQWERAQGKHAQLVGFSAHYNISFDRESNGDGTSETVEDLALLLCHILPVPVMLLATNRRSTGVGVRPRGNRIEITVDFTPSAELMIATGAFVTGVAREVMTWPSFGLDQLAEHGVPVLAGFKPIPHTSRKGWLARFDCYPANPFESDIDGSVWRTTEGEKISLRAIGARLTRMFRKSLARVSDPFTLRLIRSIMAGRAPSLLDLPDRPPEYDDVGRLCDWDDLFPPSRLRRSRYERVFIHAIAGHRLRLMGRWWRPVGMRGWSEVVFRPEDGLGQRSFSLDYLTHHLDDWAANALPTMKPRQSRRRWQAKR